MVTVCYIGLHMAGLHTVTVGFIWLQLVTYGYTGLHMVTLCYTWLH